MKAATLLVLCALAFATAAPALDALSLFRGAVKGPILERGSAEFREATTVFSPRHNIVPQFVIIPADVEDIQAAMKVATMRGLPFRVGSGNHNYEGYALAQDGVLLSLRNAHWRQVSVGADGIVTAKGGAQLIDAHRAVVPRGRGVVAGLCPSVGMVAFTLGGGYGSLSRSVGLSADNLVSLTMVLANTSVVRVSAHENTELFWALRGGGGGNLGIVTEMSIRSFPLPAGEDMFMGETCWDWELNGKEVMTWWAGQVNSESTPREVTYSLRSHFGPLDQHAQETPAESTPQQLCVQPFYYGTGSEGARVVGEQFATLPSPVSDRSFVQPWLVDVEHEHDKVNAIYGLPVYIKSAFFTELTPALVDMLHSAVANAPSIGNCIIDFDHLSGAIADVDPTATAYVNRNAVINLQIIATWTEMDARRSEYTAWVDALFAQVSPFMSGNYVNYISDSLPNWQQRYYGENYARLVQIKQSVDPKGFFSFPQSIGA